MPDTQAHRTLVKSPPELWAELSDPAALARHLGEVGGEEIRITRVEPEKAVAWEGEDARGTVEIEPSGWGTKVTLTLHREEEAMPEPVEVVEVEPVAEEVVEAEPEPEAVVEAPEPEPEPAAAEETRPRFYKRWFRRRSREAEPPQEPAVVPDEAPLTTPAAMPEAAAPTPVEEPEVKSEAEGLGSSSPPSQPDEGDRAAELLSGVLDSLGSAHHRPFSRG